MDPTRTRAAIYARISSKKDRTEQKVEDQIADCRALAEQLGLTMVEVFRDDGISANSGRRRPGYDKLLTAIRSGQIDAVVVTDTDRLDRKLHRALDYLDACIDNDVQTHTVRGGSVDLTTRAGQLSARLAAVINEDYADQVREKQREGRRHKVSRGEWGGGRRPFGYERDGVTVNRVEADALRWAASQVLAGTSLNRITAELNNRGSRTSTGREWQPTEMRRVLVRPRNAGLMQHRTCGKKQEPGKHHHNERCAQIVGRGEWPAILDEDSWRGVCAVLGDPARRTNKGTARKYLLAGIAVCGVCGGPVKSFSASARRRPTRPVYTCRSGKHVIRTAEEVDTYVEAVVVELLERRRGELLAPDQKGDTSAFHLRDAALAARLAELGRLFADGEIDADTLRAGTERVRQQREQITAQLAATSRGSVLAGVADAADPERVWRGLDLSRKRAIIGTLMSVNILPAKRGRRPGWRAGESYFDPATVRIEPKR